MQSNATQPDSPPSSSSATAINSSRKKCLLGLSQADREDIMLKKKKVMMGPTWNGISINRGETKIQQQQKKLLRETIRRMQQENPAPEGQRYIIDGTIIKIKDSKNWRN